MAGWPRSRGPRAAVRRYPLSHGGQRGWSPAPTWYLPSLFQSPRGSRAVDDAEKILDDLIGAALIVLVARVHWVFGVCEVVAVAGVRGCRLLKLPSGSRRIRSFATNSSLKLPKCAHQARAPGYTGMAKSRFPLSGCWAGRRGQSWQRSSPATTLCTGVSGPPHGGTLAITGRLITPMRCSPSESHSMHYSPRPGGSPARVLIERFALLEPRADRRAARAEHIRRVYGARSSVAHGAESRDLSDGEFVRQAQRRTCVESCDGCSNSRVSRRWARSAPSATPLMRSGGGL